MRRAALILVFGVLLGAGGYCGLYYSKTAKVRTLRATEMPELAWLREEYCLGDGEYDRVRKLHEGYLPRCAEMCARIAAVNAELQRLILATNTVTPAISAKLAEIGSLRLQCQTMMLNHFYTVAATMPADQGRRYLERMQKLTSLSNMRDHSLSAHSAVMENEQHPAAHSEHAH